jgi:dsDNA-specific endonuclease/ATPase MutS2
MLQTGLHRLTGITFRNDEEREREEKKHHLYKLKQQLEQYLQELPVVGFNAGKYDVNAMKVDFLNSIGGQSQDQV